MGTATATWKSGAREKEDLRACPRQIPIIALDLPLENTPFKDVRYIKRACPHSSSVVLQIEVISYAVNQLSFN